MKEMTIAYSIVELKEAVNKSDMDIKVKVEINEILKLYVDIAEFVSKEDYGR